MLVAISMDEKTRENYIAAGKIGTKAIAFARARTKPGVRLLDLATQVEGYIAECGGALAFPINLSSNNEAAHYTPSPDCDRVLGGHDLLKVDLGVQVDGCIADCAFSYSADPNHAALIEASVAALAAAVRTIKPGVRTREVGQAISDEITSRGFKPVANLCGHALAPYDLHAGEEVPNIPHGNYVFKEGDSFAVEPFASTGEGFIHEASDCEIFSLSSGKPRLPQSRKLQQFVSGNFGAFPFSRRAIPASVLDRSSAAMALHDLMRCGGLESYPVLVEKPGALVSQAETTVLVGSSGAVPTVDGII